MLLLTFYYLSAVLHLHRMLYEHFFLRVPSQAHPEPSATAFLDSLEHLDQGEVRVQRVLKALEVCTLSGYLSLKKVTDGTYGQDKIYIF